MSTAHSFTLNGNATAEGGVSGTDQFNLFGDENTVFLDGANATVNIVSGGHDTIDLDHGGFSNVVTDIIDLGSSAFNTLTASHELTDANLLISGDGGANTVTLVNHGGASSIELGASAGAAGNVVNLNGDASNSVALTAGDDASVAIGAAGDGFFGASGNVVLSGSGNFVSGGDEKFFVGDNGGGGNSVTLGNGADVVTLAGDHNAVSLGNGNDRLSLAGSYSIVQLGTGNNAIALSGLRDMMHVGAGGAGSTDAVTLTGSSVYVTAGDENFSVDSGDTVSQLSGALGNGSNTITLDHGRGAFSLGTSTANNATNTVTLGYSQNALVFNGGLDRVTLTDALGIKGGDTVRLNGTMLGTTLTTHGHGEQVMLTADANATINDMNAHGDMLITLVGDATGGLGHVTIRGLATDTLAHINLVNAGTYTVSADTGAAGGITLNFAHGSVDLVGLHALPVGLIT